MARLNGAKYGLSPALVPGETPFYRLLTHLLSLGAVSGP
jgi:hypothetical protein